MSTLGKAFPLKLIGFIKYYRLSSVDLIKEGSTLEFYDRNDRSINSLVELGAKGHFPLFDTTWLSEIFDNTPKKLTGNEKVQAKKLLKRVSKHRSLERKKTVILSMNETERHLVLKAFFKMVENKILDAKPELQ